MKIIGIDTASSSGSIALIDGETVLAEFFLLSQETHSRRLLRSLDRLLHESGASLSEIDALAVTVGPGSFTGIRIGLATVKGLAMATGKPVVGISTLDALSANFPFAALPVFPVVDARKTEIFTAAYYPDAGGRLRKASAELALSPESFVERISEPAILAGDALLTYGELFRMMLGAKAVFAPGPLSLIRASNVALLAGERLASGPGDDASSLVPVYLRPSYAELERP